MADTQLESNPARLCDLCRERPAMTKSGMNAKIGGSSHRTCEDCKCASKWPCFTSGRVFTYYPKIQGSSWCAYCTKKKIKGLKAKVDHLEKKIQKGACPDRFVEERDEKKEEMTSLLTALSNI